MSRTRTNTPSTDVSVNTDSVDETTETVESGQTISDRINAIIADETANLGNPNGKGNWTELPESGFSDAAVELYKSCDNNPDRAIVRKAVQTAQKVATKALDIYRANYWMVTNDSLRADKPESDKTPTDPADVVNVRIAALVQAAWYVACGTFTPDGVDVANVDFGRFATVRDVLASLVDSVELPETVEQSDVSEMAAKVASSKITRSSERHDIADVVRKAFEGRNAGDVLKLSDVRKEGGFDGYVPSSGAIRAHMEGKSPVSGFTLLPASGDAPYRIRKD